jgi:hypothetical protein
MKWVANNSWKAAQNDLWRWLWAAYELGLLVWGLAVRFPADAEVAGR